MNAIEKFAGSKFARDIDSYDSKYDSAFKDAVQSVIGKRGKVVDAWSYNNSVPGDDYHTSSGYIDWWSEIRGMDGMAPNTYIVICLSTDLEFMSQWLTCFYRDENGNDLTTDCSGDVGDFDPFPLIDKCLKQAGKSEAKKSEAYNWIAFYFCKDKRTGTEYAVIPQDRVFVVGNGGGRYNLSYLDANGHWDRLSYGYFATSCEPISDPENSKVYDAVKADEDRRIIALTESEFDTIVEADDAVKTVKSIVANNYESKKSEDFDGEEAYLEFEDAVKLVLMDKYGVVDSHGPSDETANSLVLQYGATLRDAFNKGGEGGYSPDSEALYIITDRLHESPHFFDDCKNFKFKAGESYKKSESAGNTIMMGIDQNMFTRLCSTAAYLEDDEKYWDALWDYYSELLADSSHPSGGEILDAGEFFDNLFQYTGWHTAKGMWTEYANTLGDKPKGQSDEEALDAYLEEHDNEIGGDSVYKYGDHYLVILT